MIPELFLSLFNEAGDTATVKGLQIVLHRRIQLPHALQLEHLRVLCKFRGHYSDGNLKGDEILIARNLCTIGLLESISVLFPVDNDTLPEGKSYYRMSRDLFYALDKELRPNGTLNSLSRTLATSTN